MIRKEIKILTKMSKSTGPKLNLQIRSASFKETSGSHAGTGIPKRATSFSQNHLIKARWKPEDKSVPVPKIDEKACMRKTNENHIDVPKVSPSVDKAKVETQRNAVIGASRNDVESVSKENQGIKTVTKVLRNKTSDLDRQKCPGGSNLLANKVIGNEHKDLDTGVDKQVADEKVKMKTERQNCVTSLMVNTNISKTNLVKMNDEKKITIGSLSTEISGKTETAKDKHETTEDIESQNRSSVEVESSSSKDMEQNKSVANNNTVPYNKSFPAHRDNLSLGDSNTTNAKSASDDKSDIKDNNDVRLDKTEVVVRVKDDDSQVINSKDSTSTTISSDKLLEAKGNLSKSSSNSKLKLPEKRKVSDDPETVIAELEAYLREKFGSLVDETYTQVGETETENVIESQSTNVEPEGATVLSFSSETDSDKTSEVSSPVSTPTTAIPDRKSETFIHHPIFFKTSIKKDPGSKLHDALVSELSTVLKKRDDPNSDSKETDKNEASKSDSDKSNFPRRRISAKGNKVIGDKALRQHLEDHLTRTLHKNKIFQRQSLKVLGLDTIEIKQENKTEGKSFEVATANDLKGAIPPAPIPPPVPHYGAVPLHIVPKTTTENENKTGDKSDVRSSAEAKVLVSEAKYDKSYNDKSAEPKSAEPKIVCNNEVKSDIRISDKVDVDSISDSNVSGKGRDLSEISQVCDKEAGESGSLVTKDDELLVYTYEHPSGRTEGVVCSVRTDSNPDSSGKHRKYITCVNIVAEKSGNLMCYYVLHL